MSCSLKNLAGWYSSSDIINGTIGRLNCFSELTREQDSNLMNVYANYFDPGEWIEFLPIYK